MSINDQIRRLLDKEGIDSFKNQSLVEKLACDRTLYLLENRCSVIIDANVLTAYLTVEEIFHRFSTKCFFIKLECSEKIVLKRLEKRRLQFDQDRVFSRAVKKDYDQYLEKLRLNPFPEEKVFFTIDTEKDLNQQIDVLIIQIKDFFKQPI